MRIRSWKLTGSESDPQKKYRTLKNGCESDPRREKSDSDLTHVSESETNSLYYFSQFLMTRIVKILLLYYYFEIYTDPTKNWIRPLPPDPQPGSYD